MEVIALVGPSGTGKSHRALLVAHNNQADAIIDDGLYIKDGKIIAEYPSIRDAERQTGCYKTHICACCKGKLKSTGGYIWKYKEGI